MRLRKRALAIVASSIILLSSEVAFADVYLSEAISHTKAPIEQGNLRYDKEF
jgi:hypothetical protein